MRLIKIAGLSLSVLAASAMAQDEAKSAWSGESELGFARSSGNTNSDTLNFRQKVVFDSNPWLNTFVFTAKNATSEITDANGDKEDVRTAEAYVANNKLDYFFAKRTYAFLAVKAERDRFSGYQRQFSEAVGVGHQFIKEDNMTLKAELGAGASQSKFEVRDEDGKFWQEQGLVYFGEEFMWKISAPVEIGQTLRVEAGEDTTVSNLMAYAKVQLQKSLALKMSYQIKYTDEVPEGSEKKDDLLLASLLYSF